MIVEYFHCFYFNAAPMELGFWGFVFFFYYDVAPTELIYSNFYLFAIL